MADSEKKPEQQSLLPSFEGKKPSGATVSFSGTVDLGVVAKPVKLDETVYYLVVGDVKTVGHARKRKVGLVRDQAIAVDTVVRLSELEAKRILRAAIEGNETSTRHRNDPETDDPGSD